MIDEARWRAYVIDYPVEVSRERVEEELYLIRADLKHRMVYEQMSGGPVHAFPEAELEEQRDQIFEAALFEAKEPLVLRKLTDELDIEVTPAELLAEGEAIASRDGSTLDELRRFFGEDLALLERDVRECKIKEQVLAQ